MFSIARSRYTLPVQFLFLAVNGVGVAVATIYNVKTPDLYENNAHHSIGWIATWVMVAQTVMSLLFVYSGHFKSAEAAAASEYAAFLPVSAENMAQHNGVMSPYREYRWSADSGSPTGRSSTTLNSPREVSPADPSRMVKDIDGDDDFDDEEEGLPMPLPRPAPASSSRFRIKAIDTFLARRVPGLLSQKILGVAEIGYEVVDRTILILGFIAILTGGVTLAGWMVSGFLSIRHRDDDANMRCSVATASSTVSHTSSKEESSSGTDC
jgi:hypothetical protein